MRDVTAFVGICRGCGKFVKTCWQLVGPLLFY